MERRTITQAVPSAVVAATVYNNTPQATIGGAVPAQRLYGYSLDCMVTV